MFRRFEGARRVRRFKGLGSEGMEHLPKITQLAMQVWVHFCPEQALPHVWVVKSKELAVSS